MDSQLNVQTAVKDTLPTVFGYIGIGMAFGIIGRASGLSHHDYSQFFGRGFIQELINYRRCWYHFISNHS